MIWSDITKFHKELPDGQVELPSDITPEEPYFGRDIKKVCSGKVLDVGCGFGNNLLPFLEFGCECHGTEVTPKMAAQTQEILSGRGYQAEIRCGKNDNLPYPDETFDLLLSIGVLHYAGSEEEVGRTMAEYARVLKTGGRAKAQEGSGTGWIRLRMLDVAGARGLEFRFQAGAQDRI